MASSNRGNLVSVDAAGALTGDGSTGSPLAVAVDGVTVTIDGNDQLVATTAGTGNVSAAANLTDNALVRGDGGVHGVQTSIITVTDTGEMTLGGGTTIAADAPVDLLIAGPNQNNWQFGLMNSTFSTNPNEGLLGGVDNNGNIDFFWKSYLGNFHLAATGTASFGVINEANGLTLMTPAATDVGWDATPVAALYINGPAVPSTRTFAAGIWVVTDGGSVDHGRGIGVQNNGASDSFYTQVDGAGGTGYAVLVNGVGAFGLACAVAADADGGVFEQAAGGGTATCLKVEGDIVGAAELMQINSTQTSKTGIVYRMAGAGNTAIAVKDGSENTIFSVAADTGVIATSSYLQGSEMTAPAAPAANGYRLFAQDNGAGKTQLMVIFSSGAAQQIAIQP